MAALFMALFGRLLGRWRGMLAALLGIVVYAVLAGAGAGVMRAALMVLADPHVLWDVSFQLSFMATLGLILYADPLEGWFAGLTSRRLPADSVERLTSPVGEFFLFTLAARLTTLPLILYYFRRLSLVSLIASPLVLLAQPPVMTLTGRPDAEVLAALEGYSILRTDRNGWVRLSTDGEQMWVKAETGGAIHSIESTD